MEKSVLFHAFVQQEALNYEKIDLPSLWFLWVTGGFFLISLIGHWTFGWLAFVNEQTALHQPIHASDYFIEIGRDTLENWQSEFLQLIWQVLGLAFLLCVKSPQSKEGDDRKEEKLDEIIRLVSPQNGAEVIERINKKHYS